MANANLYDLFVKKPASFPNADAARGVPVASGPGGLQLDLSQARAMKQHIRAHGGVAVVFPMAYRVPQISFEQAQAIARTAYHALAEENPANYGPLELYAETPVYWLFSADNYQLQAEGYSPGRNAFSVDKLTGELLNEAELKLRFSSLQEVI